MVETLHTTISNWENGYDIITLTKLIKFCNLYNYSLDFVCGLTRKNINYNKIKTDKETLGRKLKELRISLKLSQQQIADECSITRSCYSHYEIGRNLVSTLTLYTICKTHNVSMDWIVGRTNNKITLKS